MTPELAVSLVGRTVAPPLVVLVEVGETVAELVVDDVLVEVVDVDEVDVEVGDEDVEVGEAEHEVLCDRCGSSWVLDHREACVAVDHPEEQRLLGRM